jgi:ribosomal protein S18 acetylase RimI-like enzyme
MKDNTVAGAIWSRRLNAEHNSKAFLDENTPVLNLAVKPEFQNQGIGTAMLTQFLLEAGALYEALSIAVHDEKSKKFLEKFDFEVVKEKPVVVMKKVLEKKEIVRPSDGYDASKWMD